MFVSVQLFPVVACVPVNSERNVRLYIYLLSKRQLYRHCTSDSCIDSVQPSRGDSRSLINIQKNVSRTFYTFIRSVPRGMSRDTFMGSMLPFLGVVLFSKTSGASSARLDMSLLFISSICKLTTVFDDVSI